MTEVATFRSDGAYSDGRHPDAVRYTKTAEEDVQRRDFTINGLLLDPLAWCGSLEYAMKRSNRRDRLCGRARGSGCGRGARDWAGGDGGLKKTICGCCAAVRFAARFGFEIGGGDKARDALAGGANPCREPGAGARRADEDADRGPCAAGL